MGMKTKINRFALALLCFAPFGITANAAMQFSDDFENDLAQWTARDDRASHNGIIVDDPLRAGNSVLSFSATQIGGDVFTASAIELVEGQTYVLSFEYLGLANDGSVAGDLGGFVGIAESTMQGSRHAWVMGTAAVSSADPALVDDGQWAVYSYQFVAPATFVNNGGGTGNTIHLMFEDLGLPGSPGVAGDVYFDNIELRAVPLPAAGWLFIAGLLSLYRMRTR